MNQQSQPKHDYVTEIGKCQSMNEVNVWFRNALTASHSDPEVKADLDRITKAAEDKHDELIKDRYKTRFAS